MLTICHEDVLQPTREQSRVDSVFRWVGQAKYALDLRSSGSIQAGNLVIVCEVQMPLRTERDRSGLRQTALLLVPAAVSLDAANLIHEAYLCLVALCPVFS